LMSKAVQVSLTTKPAKRRFFRFVEGGSYRYSVTIKNVGDQRVDFGYPGDLAGFDFVWEFPGHQAKNVSRKFLEDMPPALAPKETHEFPAEEKKILSAGVTTLGIYVRSLGGRPTLEIRDDQGQ